MCIRDRFSTVPDDDAHGTGVHANPTDFAAIELSFLSVRELRAGSEPVSGISATPTGAFSWRNHLCRSRSSRSCSCSWKSDIKSGRHGRCGTLCLSQMSFKLGLLGVHNFIGLGIGIVFYIQLLSLSALTGRYNRSLVSRCRRSSSSTQPVGVRMPFSTVPDDDA